MTTQPAPSWDDDTPITLDEACEVLFRGAIKSATLMAEADRGNLRLEKIGRRFFTTPEAIREMRTRCRVQEKKQGSDSGKTATEESGSSKMDRDTAAQAALKKMLAGLKSGSPNTSQTSTSRPSAEVVPISQGRT